MSCHNTKERSNFPMTLEEEDLQDQTKTVLLADLFSMEPFYGLEDLLQISTTGLAEGNANTASFSLTKKDLLLHSAETLLEVEWLSWSFLLDRTRFIHLLFTIYYNIYELGSYIYGISFIEKVISKKLTLLVAMDSQIY